MILADIYFNDAEWEKAHIAYSSILEGLSGNNEEEEFEINMRLGISSMNLKKYDDAYQSLSVAHAIKPEVYEVNFHLGSLEYHRKNYERATMILSGAISGNHDNLDAKKMLGMALFRLKRYKEAIERLKAVIDQRMDDKETIYYLASSYFENGQLEMAVQLFSHLRPDPSFGPQASLMAGSIHLKAKSYDEAQLDFEIGLKHATIRPEVFLELNYRLASALMKKQDIAEALKYLHVIYDIAPDYKDVATQIKSSVELSRNDLLKAYLIGGPSDFVSLCRRLSAGFFSKARTKIVDIFIDKGDFADILAEVETPSWEDLILFRYMRSTGVVGEFVLRDLYTKSKDLKAGRAFCVSAGSFSETAFKFVEARSIDLVDKDGLMKHINKLQSQGG